MPFQIASSHRQRQFTQVTVRSAGSDQVHICTPTIYLEGIVEGKMSGHTILWEQISGTLVTLINGNTLTPYFDAVDGTDKTFRLWIDKGTAREQFDDVRILKTPTGFCSGAFITDQSNVSTGFDPAPVNANNITSFVDVAVVPPTTLEGEDPAGTIVTVEVSWAHPTSETRFIPYIEQYKVVENTLVVYDLPAVPIPNAGDGGGPPSGSLKYDGTFADYRIDTYYNISGKKFVKQSDTKIFSTLTQPFVKVYNDNVHSGAFNDSQSWVSRVRYGFIRNTDSESPAAASFINNQSWLTSSRYSFILNHEGLTTSASSASFSSSASHINITRYGGSGIGGG